MDNIDHGATTRESQRGVGGREELREKTPRATRRGRRRRDGERKEERGKSEDDGSRGGRSEVEVGATRWKASWLLKGERVV